MFDLEGFLPSDLNISKTGTDRGQSLPQSVMDVYNKNITMANKEHNYAKVRKAIRNHIFPVVKFLIFEDDEHQRKDWDEIVSFEKEDNLIAHLFLQGMNWFEGKHDMERAVYWNTYKGEIKRTMNQARSTILCHVKKAVVPGKCNLRKAKYLVRIYTNNGFDSSTWSRTHDIPRIREIEHGGEKLFA